MRCIRHFECIRFRIKFENILAGHFEYESMGEPPMDGYDVYLRSKNKKLTLGLKGVFTLYDNKMSNSYAVRI